MSELDARIPCTSETRTRLRRMRGDAERYEDVLQRLLQHHEDAAGGTTDRDE